MKSGKTSNLSSHSQNSVSAVPSESPEDRRWKEVFAQTSEPYWEPLLRFARTLCKSSERSEDLLQNTLVRGVRFFETFARKNLDASNPDEVGLALQDAQKSKHYKNWLYKILRNVYLDDLATQSRQNLDWDFDSFDELESQPIGSGISGNQMPDVKEGGLSLEDLEKEFYALAADDTLKEELARLTDRQRSVLYLVSEEHSYKEVAHLLGIPMGTVMSTLSRGLKSLKNGLANRGVLLRRSRASDAGQGSTFLGSALLGSTLLESTLLESAVPIERPGAAAMLSKDAKSGTLTAGIKTTFETVSKADEEGVVSR
jgi:RNA polymerase sigma factor (sigma-70 family)